MFGRHRYDRLPPEWPGDLWFLIPLSVVFVISMIVLALNS